MPRKSISFELDFMIKDILPKFTVKQFDDVSFNIKPKKQGLDYDTTGMTGKIFIGVNNDMFMQTKNITVSNNNVNILLDRNMLQKNGRAYAEVELTDSNGTITSSSFIFNIDAKIGEGAKIPGEYEGFVAKYERLISEFKSQVNETISNCNANVDNKLNTVDSLINVKISDFEKRFNRLTSSQQQDAEVIDAREDFKGVVFDSLKERIDYTDKLLRDSTVSTVETESDFTTIEQTSNGYFEDVKLEGKTLVNLCNPINVSKWFVNSTSSISNNSIKLVQNGLNEYAYTRLTNIKPNTEYTLVYSIIEKTNIASSLVLSGTINGTELFTSNLTIPKELGLNIKKFTTATKDTVDLFKFGITGGTEDGAHIIIKDILLLEGDHTQNPPSYFEGLKSVGQDADEIVVSSVKGDGNLFDAELKMGNINNGIEEVSTTQFRSDYVRVKSNTSYITNSNIELKYIYTYFYDKNKNYIGVSTTNSFTTPSNCMYIRVKSSKVDASAITKEFLNTVKIGLVMSKVAIPYTPHQADKKRLLYYNNETQTWEKPILRQWDSIEKHSDGKYYYHQRSGEVVLNGSEDWYGLYTSADYTTAFVLLTLSGTTNKFNNNITNLFKSKSYYSENIEGVWVDSNIVLTISNSKLSSQDIQGFKQWLQANNVTVVYQLAEEKVYECTNIDLITYANETNYIVESGAISPKSTLKVHNNISNVVSLLQKKVSLLESNITSYMITQNRMQLASTYSADSVTFKVDYALCSEEVEYNEDLYNLILNNILVGKDNYDYDKMFTMVLDYASWNQISWEQFDILVGLMDMQHNPPIEETPTDDEIIEEIPNEIM